MPFILVAVLVTTCLPSYTFAQTPIPGGGCVIRTQGTVASVLDLTPPDQGWVNGAIAVHNQIRARHGAYPLTFRLDLCHSALWVAAKSRDAGRPINTPAYGPEYSLNCGENLAQYPGRLFVSSSVVQNWYNEAAKYDYATGLSFPPGASTRQFTQMVWKGTREMCMTYIKNIAGNQNFIVAHYFPPGNVPGQFLANVSPLGTELEVTTPTSANITNTNTGNTATTAAGQPMTGQQGGSGGNGLLPLNLFLPVTAAFVVLVH